MVYPDFFMLCLQNFIKGYDQFFMFFKNNKKVQYFNFFSGGILSPGFTDK